MWNPVVFLFYQATATQHFSKAILKLHVCFSLQYHMLTEHGKDVGEELQCCEDEFEREYEVDPRSTHCLLCRKVYPDYVSIYRREVH